MGWRKQEEREEKGEGGPGNGIGPLHVAFYSSPGSSEHSGKVERVYGGCVW